MNEAKFQSKFNKWAANLSEETFVAELKIVHTGRFYVSQVQEHQEHALKAAKHHGLAYKIADVGMARKPFDCFVAAKNTPAYVAVMFYERGKDEFILIDIDVWLYLRYKSGVTVLSEQDCRQIGMVRRLGTDPIPHRRFPPDLHALGL